MDVNSKHRSCLTCRQKKVKCTGRVPCDYCTKRGLECNKLEPGQRRFYSVRKIQELEKRLAQFEKGNEGDVTYEDDAKSSRENENTAAQELFPQASPSEKHDAGPSFLGASYGIPTPGAQSASPMVTNESNEATDSSPGSAIPADSALSSSNTFGSRVLELLGPPRGGPSRIQTQPNPAATPEPHSRRYTEPIPSLPTEAEAQRLVEAVNFFIGHTQSHYDPRAFLDRLEVFYANRDDPAHTRSLWFLEMVVVFAIGKLFLGEQDEDEDEDDREDDEPGLPGIKLFEFAHGNLPTLSEQYSHGRLGVEIFALMAVYLQNVERKEEAYIYISTALRLAVAHGFHRQSGVGHLLQSERVQINRLWWTVYMQERRVAAATGNPCGINDEAIELDLPSDSPGFGPAAPLRINIKIAQVTGRIIAVLYGARDRTQDAFVSKVQEIVRSLYDISKEIPSELATDVHAPGPELPIRTSAYLQLMLLQATLLTIRPIMLHVAQLILGGNLPSGESLDTSALGRLSRICSEAARRLLSVVLALKKRKIMAIFGFFDCDATFSAAFIMILTAIFDSTCRNEQQINPSPGLDDALETLRYLASQKNHIAIQRLAEVQKVWEHLAPYLRERRAPSGGTDLQPEGAEISNEIMFTDDTETHRGSRQKRQRVNPSSDQRSSVRQSREPGPDVHSSAQYWYGTVVGQTDGGDLGAGSSNGTQQAVLPQGLWDDLSYLWCPPTDSGAQGGMGMGSLDSQGAETIFPGHFQALLGSAGWEYTGEDADDFAELERHILHLNSKQS